MGTLEQQRALVEAAEALEAARGHLVGAGYGEWDELLSHIRGEVRGEVTRLEKESTDDAASE